MGVLTKHPELFTAADLFNDQFNADQHVYGSDSFNRTDSASSLGALDGGEKSGMAYTMTGNAVYGIDTNRARYFSGTGQAVHDYGASDVEIQLTSVVHAAGRLITFRYIDENNNFILYEDASADYLIRRIVGGSISTVASFTTTAADNDVLKVVLLGSSIQVFVNGVRQINITDTNHQSATMHGLSLNGTTNRVDAFSVKAIVPNPGKWTKVDTESKFTQTNGLGSFSGGKASPAFTDPFLYVTNAFARRAGLCLEIDLASVPSAAARFFLGWFSTAISAAEARMEFDASGNIKVYDSSAERTVGVYTATPYRIRIVAGHWDVANRLISTNGATFYIQGGVFGAIDSSQWSILWRTTLGTAAALYASLYTYSAALGAGKVRVYNHPFPMPRVYDSMVRADGAIGSAESGQAYTNAQGTALITSNEGYWSSDTNGDRCYVNAGIGDGIFGLTVKGEIDATNFRIPRFDFRKADASVTDNGLRVSVHNGSTVALTKTGTTLASATFAGSDDTFYELTVLAIGAVIRVFVNGTFYFSHTLTGGNEVTYSNANTYVGPGLVKGGSPSVAARFKNLFVQLGLGV